MNEEMQKKRDELAEKNLDFHYPKESGNALVGRDLYLHECMKINCLDGFKEGFNAAHYLMVAEYEYFKEMELRYNELLDSTSSKQLSSLQSRIRELEGALEFYGQGNEWDFGYTANKALANQKEES